MDKYYALVCVCKCVSLCKCAEAERNIQKPLPGMSRGKSENTLGTGEIRQRRDEEVFSGRQQKHKNPELRVIKTPYY